MSQIQWQNPVVHKPTIELAKISGAEYRAKLEQAWDWKDIDLDDAWYFYPRWEDWDAIFQYVQKNLGKWTEDVWDCDNFAFYISVMVSKEFNCNACNVVEGYWKGARHKWNVFFDGDGFYQLESQKYQPPDSIGDLDDPDYVPDEIIAF